MIIDNNLKKLLARTMSAIESVDLTMEESAIAILDKNSRTNSEAVAKVEKQLIAIGRQLREEETDEGEKVADAVLNDDTTAAEALAPSIETLRERRNSLIKGRLELMRRNSQIARKKRQLQVSADTKIQVTLDPLVEELEKRQKAAANEIADIHAGISAISLCSNGHISARHRGQLSLEGLMGQLKLLPGERYINIPDEIAKALDVLKNKGPLARPLRTNQIGRW